MNDNEVFRGIACCGLSCAICCHAVKGCPGCGRGGGPSVCFARNCCTEHGFDGCWQCESFPCPQSSSDDAWRGLTTGCVCVIKAMGVEKFANLARSRLGEGYDYGYLRYRTAQEIEGILRGEQEVPGDDPDAR